MKAKKVLAIVLAMAMVLSTMSFTAFAEDDAAAELLDAVAEVVIADDSGVATVEGNTVTLNGGEIKASADGESAISILSGDVTIKVDADTTLTGANGGAGIYVAEGASVTITGTGVLTAIGNGGVEDTTAFGGAGIGGTAENGASGKITIIDATVNAIGYGKHASGIGSAKGSLSKEIVITDSVVNAKGGCYVEGGISLDLDYAKTDPEGGAGIGGGYGNGDFTGNITITGSTVTANGGQKAAGIGTGYWCGIEKITIDNSKVTATGGASAAAIGMGRYGKEHANLYAGINIKSSTIDAKGGYFGAGIGNGYNTDSCPASEMSTTTINISDSTVTAVGGAAGAGIGGGYKSNNLDIDIVGESVITAIAGLHYNEEKSDSYRCASAIGSGANGSGTFVGASVAIAETVEVEAYTNGGKPAVETKDANGNANVIEGEVAVYNKVISTLDELIAFAYEVNAGNTYAGKTVKLADDINLNNMEWTPIGNSTNKFLGTFDGTGHTISNLKVTGSNSYVGLFGYASDGELRNINIHNASVSGRLGVGALAGSPYTSAVNNINLTGHVEINGMSYVGGLLGRNLYNDASNLVINVDDTSYVKAYSIENGENYRTYVGGVVGFMGENGHTVSNITTNIDVYGSTCDIGGVTGIAHYGNTFENCLVTGDVYLTEYSDESEGEIGGIAGVWHNGSKDEGVKFINCRFAGNIYRINKDGEYVADETPVAVGAPYYAEGSDEAVGELVEEETFITVARINDNYYGSLAEAAAAAQAGDTIILTRDSVEETTAVVNTNVTIDGNGHTVTGAAVANAEEYNTTAVTPLSVTSGANVVINNITLQGGSLANSETYQPGVSYGIAGAGLKVKDATVTINNSSIIGGASTAAFTKSAGEGIVATGKSSVTVNDSYVSSGELDSEYTIGLSAIVATDEVELNLKNVTLNAPKSSYANAYLISGGFEDDGDEVTRETVVTASGVIKIMPDSIPLSDVKIQVPEGEDIRFVGDINEDIISANLSIVFETAAINDAAEEEVADLYDIYVEGNAQFINRLNSADLTFLLESTAAKNAAMTYEIIPVEPVSITLHGENKDRYLFNFDGVTQPDETANRIKIAQVKISGYGEYELSVDKNAGENIVNTAKTANNVVEHFYVGGSANNDGELNIDSTAKGTIEIPTRNLVINVAFPNAVSANEKAYQQMTVTVTGPDYNKVLYLSNGKDGADSYNLQTDENGVVYYSTDNANSPEVEGLDLVLNTPYTVTVEGAGYRTAKYTVSMTEDKTLNFWNNVMDNDTYVEESASGNKNAQKVTFLAGDIVKDNNINVYDLSAVVSYFGEINLSASNKADYAKYDLNRDGKIDSKDVAYVLVSWGN